MELSCLKGSGGVSAEILTAIQQVVADGLYVCDSVASLTVRAAFRAKSWRLHLCASNCCSMSSVATSGVAIEENSMLQYSQMPSRGFARTIRSFEIAMLTVPLPVERLSNPQGFRPAALKVSAIACCCALWRSLGTNCSEIKSLCAPMPLRSGQPLGFMFTVYSFILALNPCREQTDPLPDVRCAKRGSGRGRSPRYLAVTRLLRFVGRRVVHRRRAGERISVLVQQYAVGHVHHKRIGRIGPHCSLEGHQRTDLRHLPRRYRLFHG